jgi:hypothetical protein
MQFFNSQFPNIKRSRRIRHVWCFSGSSESGVKQKKQAGIAPACLVLTHRAHRAKAP